MAKSEPTANPGDSSSSNQPPSSTGRPPGRGKPQKEGGGAKQQDYNRKGGTASAPKPNSAKPLPKVPPGKAPGAKNSTGPGGQETR